MIIAPGTTSRSIDVQLVDDAGLPLTGKLAADFPAVYWSLAGNTASTLVTLSDLAAITTAYSSGGIKERAGSAGIYRLDAPDAALANAGVVRIYGEGSGKHVLQLEPIEVRYVAANLVQILGTTLTETAGQIAAAVKKFFNVAIPTSTMNEITLVDTVTTNTDMRGTDGALTSVGDVTLAASQPNYAPAKAGDKMNLIDAPNAAAVAAIQNVGLTLNATVNDPSPTAASFIGSSGLNSATDDFYKGCVLAFTSGDLAVIAREVSGYTAATKTFTFDGATGAADAPFPSAPANGDAFKLLGRIGG